MVYAMNPERYVVSDTPTASTPSPGKRCRGICDVTVDGGGRPHAPSVTLSFFSFINKREIGCRCRGCRHNHCRLCRHPASDTVRQLRVTAC